MKQTYAPDVPARIMVPLDPDVSRALRELAENEKRHPKDQVAFLLRRSLVALGYLKDNAPLCPQCFRPTIPDPNRPGCYFCTNCGEPVLAILATEASNA